MFDFILNKLESIESVVIIISVIVALFQYIVNEKKDRRSKEIGTYDSLDNKFIEFQLLCMEKPYLDIFDVPDKVPAKLNDEQKKRRINRIFSSSVNV